MRRSFVIISVLIIVVIALLITTALLFVMQADAAGRANESRLVQSRSLAMSGVQAVVNRLDTQRDEILDGRMPRLDESFVLFDHGDRIGIVRLLPIGPGGERLVPEAGRLDVNVVSAETLEGTGLIDGATASRIVTRRDERPFQSVAELLEVPGVGVETLYGPPESWGESSSSTVDGPRGLADLVTVFGVEPALQRSGRRRINLNVPWSEELGRRVDDRFGEGTSVGLKQIFDNGTTFDSDAKVVEILRFFDTDPSEWAEILDAVTAESGQYHFGRVDINSASYEVLAAMPELTPEAAAQIVKQRDGLPIERTASPTWPIIEKIIDGEAYQKLAGRVTTRCWTYRVRLEAGEVDADDIDGPIEHPVVTELVVDLAVPEARIAYLRDVTLLETATLLLAARGPDDSELGSDQVEQDPFEDGMDPTEDDLDPIAPDADDDTPRGDDEAETTLLDLGSTDMEPARPEDRSPPDMSDDTPPAAPVGRRVGRWQGDG